MNIKYELTKQDYIDYNIYHLENSKSMRRILIIQRFLLPIVFLIIPPFISSISEVPLWYWYCVFSIVAVLWVIFYPKLMKRTMEKRITRMLEEGKTEGLLGKHEVFLSGEGIVDKTEISETSYKSIEKIEETEAHLLVYVSAVMAYIIPKRAFASDIEKNECINILKGMKNTL